MSVYDTKTVRLHLQERGQYVYLMLTRFDGEDHLLADEGWRGEYIHYSTVERNAEYQDSVTGDAFAFIRGNERFQDTIVEGFVKDLDTGRIDWSDLEDEDLLTESDVRQLAGREEAVVGGEAA